MRRLCKQNWYFIVAVAVAGFLVIALFLTNWFSNLTPDILDHKGESLLVNDLRFEGRYYINLWEFTITDTSKIKKIGEVEKANFLVEGSDIYAIEGYPDRNFIAVEDNESFNGYSIFSEYKAEGEPIPIPQDISYASVKEIKVYKEKELINVIQGEDVQKFISLFEQEGPHNKFLVDDPPLYNVLFLTNSSLAYKYPISEKDGEFGLPVSESKLPKQIADYFKPKQ